MSSPAAADSASAEQLHARRTITIANTGGRARVRLEALRAIVEACGIQARRPMSPFELTGTGAGDLFLRLYGDRDLVAELETTYEQLLAEMETAATRAVRGYSGWLRRQDDHEPGDRRGLRRAWRARYLHVWGQRYAERIHAARAGRPDALPSDGPALDESGYSMHRQGAGQARADVDQLDPDRFHALAARIPAEPKILGSADPAWVRLATSPAPDPALSAPAPTAPQPPYEAGQEPAEQASPAAVDVDGYVTARAAVPPTRDPLRDSSRIQAVVAILRAYGIEVAGECYQWIGQDHLVVTGRPAVLAAACTRIEAWLAEMDAAADAGTKTHRAWLDQRPPTVHKRANTDPFAHAWCCTYTTSWGVRYAERIRAAGAGWPDALPDPVAPNRERAPYDAAYRDVDQLHPERFLAAAATVRAAEAAAGGAPDRLVIVSCGGSKLNRPAPAGQIYVGSYHRACRRAANVLAGDDARVMILSAKYGLVDLDQVIEPYEQRAGRDGAITAFELRRQAGRLGLLSTREVTVLGGHAYVDLVSAVWPHARRPLDGTRGIGEQLARLSELATTGTTAAMAGTGTRDQDENPAAPTTAQDSPVSPIASPAPDIDDGLLRLLDVPVQRQRRAGSGPVRRTGRTRPPGRPRQPDQAGSRGRQWRQLSLFDEPSRRATWGRR